MFKGGTLEDTKDQDITNLILMKEMNWSYRDLEETPWELIELLKLKINLDKEFKEKNKNE